MNYEVDHQKGRANSTNIFCSLFQSSLDAANYWPRFTSVVVLVYLVYLCCFVPTALVYSVVEAGVKDNSDVGINTVITQTRSILLSRMDNPVV